MAKMKKLLVAALSIAMVASIGVAGASALSNAYDNATVAVAEETATERSDVKVTKITQDSGTAACVYFDLEGRTGNGTNVSNKKKVGNYIYYNGEMMRGKVVTDDKGTPDDPSDDVTKTQGIYFDVHMRSNMFWLYPQAGTTLKEGDTLTFQKGMSFPVVTNDGESYSEFKDTLGETVVYKWTGTEWVNQTELNKAAQPKIKVTEIAAGMGNGESLKTNLNGQFPDSGNDHNYARSEDWVEVAGYILYNGEVLGSQFDVHMMSGNFYIYPNTGFSFSYGDTVTILEGLHCPANAVNAMDSTPSYANQTYHGYITETFTAEYTAESGWIRKSTNPEPLSIGGITEVKQNEAGALMPATYEFTVNFDLRVSSDELADLETYEVYSKNVYVDGKSVYDWNNEVSVEDNDGEKIPAISLSAYGTGLTVTVVKDSNIVKDGANFSVKVGKDIAFASGNYLENDVVRYYISGLGYWSTIEPYTIEKTQALSVASVDAFEVIDGGANGCLYINFNEAIATKQLLAYNFHPEYLKTLPAAAYPVDMGDDFASSGATLSFINNVYINGKSMAEYWTELSGAEAKSSLYQCHIFAVEGVATRIRIGSAVSNGWSGNDAIEIVLKKGLTFFNGAYLDYDVTINYTPASGDVVASTTYSVEAESVALSADKTTLVLGETATLTATPAPAAATGAIVYASSDEKVATVSAEGVVTAFKAGTAVITAKIGGVVSNEVTVTVTNPAATAIQLSASATELLVGGTATLTAVVTPETYEGTLVYVSSDKTVATVSAEGVVTAVKAGTVKITAKIGDLVSNEVTVTVTEPESPVTSEPEASVPETSVPETSELETSAPATSDPATSGDKQDTPATVNCFGSALTLAVAAPVVLGAAAIVLKKKED